MSQLPLTNEDLWAIKAAMTVRSIKSGPKSANCLAVIDEDKKVEFLDLEFEDETPLTTMSTPEVHLPPLPEGWSADKDFKAIGKLSAPTIRTIEPVG